MLTICSNLKANKKNDHNKEKDFKKHWPAKRRKGKSLSDVDIVNVPARNVIVIRGQAQSPESICRKEQVYFVTLSDYLHYINNPIFQYGRENWKWVKRITVNPNAQEEKRCLLRATQYGIPADI